MSATYQQRPATYVRPPSGIVADNARPLDSGANQEVCFTFTCHQARL